MKNYWPTFGLPTTKSERKVHVLGTSVHILGTSVTTHARNKDQVVDFYPF